MKALAIAVLSLVALSSCAGAPAAKTTPSNCVFQREEAATVYRDFAGAKVGFCCNQCAARWDGMTDEAKKAALAAMKK
ncbi:MAG: hypothetical protein KDC87_00330 [Planctomycetes bacterium]|nr:hypothetical protein [Planctomycetota bacterium]MCB9869810.1 hypothetical protein [Planctomycetota bacterium]